LRTLTSYLLLTLLCLLLFVPGINTLPVVDRDSAHFSQATKQMLETGNYFQIRYQESTRFQKPPGINWLQALSVKLIGADTHAILAYRLPSVLGAMLAVLLLFSFARPICGQPVALLASALLAVTLLLTVEAHMAVTDTMLLATMVLMQGALWRIYLTFNAEQPKSLVMACRLLAGHERRIFDQGNHPAGGLADAGHFSYCRTPLASHQLRQTITGDYHFRRDQQLAAVGQPGRASQLFRRNGGQRLMAQADQRA
jgi:hypothetical protein